MSLGVKNEMLIKVSMTISLQKNGDLMFLLLPAQLDRARLLTSNCGATSSSSHLFTGHKMEIMEIPKSIFKRTQRRVFDRVEKSAFSSTDHVAASRVYT